MSPPMRGPSASRRSSALIGRFIPSATVAAENALRMIARRETE